MYFIFNEIKTVQHLSSRWKEKMAAVVIFFRLILSSTGNTITIYPWYMLFFSFTVYILMEISKC